MTVSDHQGNEWCTSPWCKIIALTSPYHLLIDADTEMTPLMVLKLHRKRRLAKRPIDYTHTPGSLSLNFRCHYWNTFAAIVKWEKRKNRQAFLQKAYFLQGTWKTPNHNIITWLPVADPGFPRGGGANPKGGAPTYYLDIFSWKLHENEEILGQRGGRVPRAPLRSATDYYRGGSRISQEECQLLKGDANILFDQSFSKNCMKTRKSYCVNARGMLHTPHNLLGYVPVTLSWPGGKVHPVLGRGYPYPG